MFYCAHPTYCDARLHVLHRHGCNYGHGLRLASTVYVQSLDHARNLFIVYCSASAFPHFYSVTGPTLAVGALLLEQAHWFSELWLQPMLAASDLCPLLGWGRSGQHPRVKTPLASQLRRWSLCNKICIQTRYYVYKSDYVCKILTHSYCDDLRSSLSSTQHHGWSLLSSNIPICLHSSSFSKNYMSKRGSYCMF